MKVKRPLYPFTIHIQWTPELNSLSFRFLGVGTQATSS